MNKDFFEYKLVSRIGENGNPEYRLTEWESKPTAKEIEKQKHLFMKLFREVERDLSRKQQNN